MNLLDSHFMSFFFVTLMLTVSPGVDTFIVIRNVLRGGKKDGIFTSLGICSGLFVHAALSACGISVLLVQSAFLFHGVKIAGAFYLCWLGIVSLFNAARRNVLVLEDTQVTRKIIVTGSFREGFLSNILNPKPAIFYLAFFPQFIQASDPVLIKSMFLASIQFIVGLTWLVLLSLFVYKINKVLRSTFFRKILDTINGCILVAFGVGLFWESKG